MMMITADEFAPDSAESWRRMTIGLLISTVGGVGLWSYVVSLPAIESAFGTDRGGASLPYTATLLGFALGGVVMGRLADRYGVTLPIIIASVALCLGFACVSFANSIWQVALAQGMLIGVGASVMLGPLVADISHWFVRRRGIAVAIVASGNYLAGTVWPPLLQYAIETIGWRQAHFGIGIVCLIAIPPLALLLRRRAPIEDDAPVAAGNPHIRHHLPISSGTIQLLLIVAGLACCVAMSMPQVHIVALCTELGYGPARGAEMLSAMLGLGVVSRIASGFIADKIGGAGTLLLGSALQCMALALYLPFDGLISLYVVSAFFGLAQGGIVPSYALIVRDLFPAREAGTRVGLVIMATVVGMALGGWMSGEIFDITGAYSMAFLNGIAWNFLNMAIAAGILWMYVRTRLSMATAAAQ